MTRPLALLPGRYAVCRLAADAAIPAWASAPRASLLSVTRTDDELSIVCDESMVPVGFARIEPGWRAIRIRGTIPFGELGVVAGVTAPLAAAGVSVFVISTFDTDYLLVPAGHLEVASAALNAAGFEVN